jgi:transcriptional regulator with XRE-family HTH domain
LTRAIKNILAALADFEKTSDSVGVEFRVSLSEIVIRHLRIRKWNQRQLAEATGLKESYISRVLHSNANCTLDTIGTLFFALGIRGCFQERAATGFYETAGEMLIQGQGTDNELIGQIRVAETSEEPVAATIGWSGTLSCGHGQIA